MSKFWWMVLPLLVAAGLAHPAFAQADAEMLAGDPLPAPAPAPPPADDLAQAADATADVAALGAPAPEPEASAPLPPVDVDLAIGMDPAGFDDRLQIYGFADFTYLSDNWDTELAVVQQHTRSFMSGNLNLYLAKNLTARARTLAEVRFTFLPNGSVSLTDGSIYDDAAADPTNSYRTTQWGSVIIERAYVEYDLLEHLTIRAGHWLTPYGIWNIDHGSPVVITPGRPYIIGEQFFPEHQTGLELFGSHYHEGFRIGYHLTASNGRGAAEAQLDQDSRLAFGGRLELETPWGLKLGGSYYRGRYTGARGVETPAPTYLEAAYGADARFERGPLLLQAEMIARDKHYPADALGVAAMSGTGTVPGGRDFGFYVLAGYRFSRLWSIMPFVFAEDEEPADHSVFTRSIDVDVGVNLRPTDSLVLKAMLLYDMFDGHTGLVDGHQLTEINLQAAWAF